MAVTVAILSGLLPAIRVARTGLANAGRGTTTADRSQHRLRAGLVVAEVALALVLVSGAGLLIRSFVGLDECRSRLSARSRAGNAGLRLGPQPHAGSTARLSSTRHRAPGGSAGGSACRRGLRHALHRVEHQHSERDHDQRAATTDRGRSAASVPDRRNAGILRRDADPAQKLAGRSTSETGRTASGWPSSAKRWRTVTGPAGTIRSATSSRFRFSGAPTEVEIVGVVGALRHDSSRSGRA